MFGGNYLPDAAFTRTVLHPAKLDDSGVRLPHFIALIPVAAVILGPWTGHGQERCHGGPLDGRQRGKFFEQSCQTERGVNCSALNRRAKLALTVAAKPDLVGLAAREKGRRSG